MHDDALRAAEELSKTRKGFCVAGISTTRAAAGAPHPVPRYSGCLLRPDTRERETFSWIDLNGEKSRCQSMDALGRSKEKGRRKSRRPDLM